MLFKKRASIHQKKTASLFESNTDIIVKGFRKVQYGHKINLSSERSGFITCLFIEKGNISELKRAFGATKANWKGLDGFKAYVWSSVLSYNLMRLARLASG